MPENFRTVFTCWGHNQIIAILSRGFSLFKHQGYGFAFQNKICSIGRSDWASRYNYSRCCLIGLGHYDTRNRRCLSKNNKYGGDYRVMWCYLVCFCFFITRASRLGICPLEFNVWVVFSKNNSLYHFIAILNHFVTFYAVENKHLMFMVIN